MKLKAGEVFGAAETIQKLASVKLPLKGKYWIGRIAAKLAPEYQVIMEQRNELIKKHGEEADGQVKIETTLTIETDGVKTVVPNPAYALFVADLGTLMSQDIEVDCPQVKLNDLGNAETDVDLTPLLPFISEGENAVA